MYLGREACAVSIAFDLELVSVPQQHALVLATRLPIFAQQGAAHGTRHLQSQLCCNGEFMLLLAVVRALHPWLIVFFHFFAQISVFCMSAAASGAMFVRWRRMSVDGRQRVWRLYS